jgi:hypothetical protein
MFEMYIYNQMKFEMRFISRRKKILIIWLVCIISISLISASYFTGNKIHDQTVSNNTTNGTDNVSNDLKIDVNKILIACGQVKQFKDENGSLPAQVLIDNENYTISQFLYLISNVIVNGNNSSNITNDSPISFSNDFKPSFSESNNSTKNNNIIGKLNKTMYVNNALTIVDFMKSTNKTPNYLETYLGNLSMNVTTYKFAEIGSVIEDNNGTLPEFIKFNSTVANPMTHGQFIGDINNVIDPESPTFTPITQIARDLYAWGFYGKNGDCYSFSNWVAEKLADAGYSCAIYQGSTELGNHRCVKLSVNGANYWFETCRCVQNGWGVNPYNWAIAYNTWNPQGIIKSFKGFNG